MIEGLFFILNRLEVGDPSVTQEDVDSLRARVEQRDNLHIDTKRVLLERIDELWERVNGS